MTRPSKIFLGALSLFPMTEILFFVGFVAYSVAHPSAMAHGAMFPTLFVAHFTAILVTFGMMAYYVIHALTKNNRLTDQTQRMLWALMLFMGNMIAIPIYYFMYILPEHDARLAQ